jgi:hypothetical protein
MLLLLLPPPRCFPVFSGFDRLPCSGISSFDEVVGGGLALSAISAIEQVLRFRIIASFAFASSRLSLSHHRVCRFRIIACAVFSDAVAQDAISSYYKVCSAATNLQQPLNKPPALIFSTSLAISRGQVCSSDTTLCT